MDPHDFFDNLERKPRFKNSAEETQFVQKEIEKEFQSLEKKNIPYEQKREEAAEHFLEQYTKQPQENLLEDGYRAEDSEMEGITLRLSPEDHDTIIEDLYGILLKRGLKNTLEIVSKMGNDHILDDFHRFLVQYLASHYELPGLKPKSDLSKSLGLRIFEVILPNKKVTGESRDFKQIVSLMEQFMAGMQSIASDPRNKEKNYYTLELALPEGEDDMSLYVTVPESRADLFEKQLLGLFEDVKITEVFDDYNIFSYSGVSSSAYAEYTQNDVLTLKTYDNFDHDPMSVLVNTFSKLKKSGEGAAVQFIVMPIDSDYIKEYGEILDNLKKGDTLKVAAKKNSFISDFRKNVGDVFSQQKEENKTDIPEKKIDEDAIREITEKLNSTIVQTNIRIITSAETKQRSDEILHSLSSAFQQFNNPKGNGIRFETQRGSQLEQSIQDFVFRFFNDRYTFKLNLKELSTLFHFPLEISETSQLKQESNKSAPAPSDTPQEGIILGKNVFRHREMMIHMTPEDRLRHFYVIGQTGTGKTHLLKQMLIQDIKNGEGVCFIDPHGSDIQDILDFIPPERIDDVIYFDPSSIERPMGLNMLEFDPRYPEQKSFVINEMMGIFNKLFDMKVGGGAMFEQYFRNSAGLVMEHLESGSTLLEIGRVLADKNFRDLKLQHCKNPIIKQFWENAEKTTGEQGLENFVPYITSKFDPMISNEIMRPIIAQQTSSFNFRDIMDSKKILLVNLSKGRLGEINANLIGLILVGKILMAALSRVDSLDKELPPFYLYIDEFQNVTTNSISQILSEARKYGLGLIVAHQFIAQLDEGIKNAVFGNVGSMASFRISFEDAQYVEKRFLPQFSADDIMRIPNRNAYIQMIGNGKPLVPFNIQTLPLEYFVQKNPQGVSEKIKQISFLKYGKPREEVERDIMGRYR